MKKSELKKLIKEQYESLNEVSLGKQLAGIITPNLSPEDFYDYIEEYATSSEDFGFPTLDLEAIEDAFDMIQKYKPIDLNTHELKNSQIYKDYMSGAKTLANEEVEKPKVDIKSLVVNVITSKLGGIHKPHQNMGDPYKINTKDPKAVLQVFKEDESLKQFQPWYEKSLESIIIGEPGGQVKVMLSYVPTKGMVKVF